MYQSLNILSSLIFSFLCNVPGFGDSTNREEEDHQYSKCSRSIRKRIHIADSCTSACTLLCTHSTEDVCSADQRTVQTRRCFFSRYKSCIDFLIFGLVYLWTISQFFILTAELGRKWSSTCQRTSDTVMHSHVIAIYRYHEIERHRWRYIDIYIVYSLMINLIMMHIY